MNTLYFLRVARFPAKFNWHFLIPMLRGNVKVAAKGEGQD